MKVLVTGSKGFVGLNLVTTLKSKEIDVYEFDKDSSWGDLEKQIQSVDFVVHLAGVNRPKDLSEFQEGNTNLTSQLCELLQQSGNKAPLLLSSSIQALQDNQYGQSKKAAEEVVLNHGLINQSEVFIYRFKNLFGKWSKPNYNSVIATWCHNIARNLDISVNDRSTLLKLEYIDDVLSEIINAIQGNANRVDSNYCEVKRYYEVSLGEIADLLKKFRDSRSNLELPELTLASFEKRLYSTYLTYLPKDEFKYALTTHSDDRGSFTEFVRSEHHGQVSINISKPGVVKGNHWHHSKNEKFLVVKGHGIIQFRNIINNDFVEYHVGEDSLEVVDIPPGYTHNIINIGEGDMITVMWVNESFDPNRPDTFREDV